MIRVSYAKPTDASLLMEMIHWEGTNEPIKRGVVRKTQKHSLGVNSEGII